MCKQAEAHAIIPLGRTLVRLPRVVCRLGGPPAASASAAASATSLAAAAATEADEALVDALVAQGWLLDIGAADSPLREHSRPLAALLKLPRTPPLASVQRWLQQAWKAPPPPSPMSPDGSRLAAAFSLAVRHCVAQHCGPSLDPARTAAGEQSPAALGTLKAHRAALDALPGLHLWLSTRPQKSSGAGGSWVRFPPANGARHPLLCDDEIKAPFLVGLPCEC